MWTADPRCGYGLLHTTDMGWKSVMSRLRAQGLSYLCHEFRFTSKHSAPRVFSRGRDCLMYIELFLPWNHPKRSHQHRLAVRAGRECHPIWSERVNVMGRCTLTKGWGGKWRLSSICGASSQFKCLNEMLPALIPLMPRVEINQKREN